MSVTKIAQTFHENAVKAKTDENKANIEDFRVGDTINVRFKIQESGKERVSFIEGVCIRHTKGVNPSVTIRKIVSNIGAEKTIPLYSPLFVSLKVVSRGVVRRAFLSYLRKVKGMIKIKLKLFKKKK